MNKKLKKYCFVKNAKKKNPHSLGVNNRRERMWGGLERKEAAYLYRRVKGLPRWGSWPRIHLTSDKEVLPSDSQRGLGGCHTLCGSHSSNKTSAREDGTHWKSHLAWTKTHSSIREPSPAFVLGAGASNAFSSRWSRIPVGYWLHQMQIDIYLQCK